MTAIYNENEPFAADWLTNLVDRRHIAPGIVERRSIRDLTADDVRGFTQFHAFAGIGVWSYALRAAGVPDDFPVWTGSCPCQPFSIAGRGAGFADERHLWPIWFSLIRECRPPVIFGEQVASADGLKWFDSVHADLEAEGYAVGASDLCAAGVGAPHIRQRLFFVAYADGIQGRLQLPRWGSERANAQAVGRSEVGALANGEGNRCRMGDASGIGSRRHARAISRSKGEGENGGQEAWGVTDKPFSASSADRGPVNGFWRDAAWLACADGKSRPVEPGTFPLAHGVAGRVGRLRAYGNAVVAEAAVTFVRAAFTAMPSRSRAWYSEQLDMFSDRENDANMLPLATSRVYNPLHSHRPTKRTNVQPSTSRQTRVVKLSDLHLEYGGFKNPRLVTGLSDESIAEMAQSIKDTNGIIDPPKVVRVNTPDGVINVLWDGQRRFLGARKALGKSGEIEVIDLMTDPVEMTPEMVNKLEELALVTGLKRDGLSSYELLEVAERRRSQGQTLAQISPVVGRSITWLSRMLKARGAASPSLLEKWKAGQLTDEQFKDLAGAGDATKQDALADDVVSARASGDKASARAISKEVAEQTTSETKKARAQAKELPSLSPTSEPKAPKVQAPPRAIMEDVFALGAKRPPTHDYVKGLLAGVGYALGLVDAADFQKPWIQYLNRANDIPPPPKEKVKVKVAVAKTKATSAASGKSSAKKPSAKPKKKK